MHHPIDRITHTTAFVTPVVEQWLEREIAQWVHPMKDRSDDPSHHERTLLPRSYISLPHHTTTRSRYAVPTSSRLIHHNNRDDSLYQWNRATTHNADTVRRRLVKHNIHCQRPARGPILRTEEQNFIYTQAIIYGI